MIYSSYLDFFSYCKNKQITKFTLKTIKEFSTSSLSCEQIASLFAKYSIFIDLWSLYIELILPYQSTNNSHIDLSLSSFYNEPNRLFVFNEVKNASFIKITIDHEDILFDFPSSLKGQQCYDLLRKLKKKQTNPSKEQRNYECIFIDLFLIE